MITYLFPGQGSQSKGMGKELFSQFPDEVEQANELLGYSLESLCTEDPENLLNNTQYTQPALYVVSALSYLKALKETKKKPDYVAGHSLGEYNALFAAGVFDFITGLTLVKQRGKLMSQAKEGSMAAIIGLNAQELTQTLAAHDLKSVTIANYNSYKQLVISGLKVDMDKAQKALESNPNARVIPLSASGAFHSSYMLEAQQAFALFLEPFEFSTPYIPVVSNVEAALYHPAVIKKHLAHQITHSVEWTRIIEYLQKKSNMNFKEIGPGTVLTGLLGRINNHQ